MKRILALMLGAVLLPNAAAAQETAAAPLHTTRSFDFVVRAPLAEVGPLFGADKERVWSPGWNPTFVWPTKAEDRDGMVFTLAHEGKTAVWVNTCFEWQNGRVQYVYVIPDTLVTVITLRLQPQGTRTYVEVVYRRTSLTAAANSLVAQMADRDAKAGPIWEKQINGYLAAHHD